MPRRPPVIEHLAFLVGALVVAPVTPLGLLMVYLSESRFDGEALFTIVMGAAIIGFVAFAVLEFETDGLISWFLGGGVQVPRLGLGYLAGMLLKGLAIVHGVTALIFGSLLAMDGSEISHMFSSWGVGGLIGLRVLFVIWLWVMTVAAYLAGDGWMRRAQRLDGIEG